VIASADFTSTLALQSTLTDLWTPRPRQRLSDWAEANITLSSDYSASSSRLRLYGWQREIFDSFTDPYINEIVLCVSTQSVKTLFLQNCIAYAICEAPGPILLIQPNDDDARTFSKERLAPMIRDNEVLRARISESVTDKINTIVTKLFPGGNLSLVGSNAPSNLARRAIRYLFCDEVDKYPASAGREGDPLDLASERLATFRSRRKSVVCCSPTDEQSRIIKAYAETDMRQPWVRCLFCEGLQILKWVQVRWPKQQPSQAAYHCSHCDHPWTDVQRVKACDAVTWIPQRPTTNAAGFWLNQLYLPSKSIVDLARQWYKVYRDPERRKTFINTVLAEQYQIEGDRPDEKALFARREPYDIGLHAVIPKRAVFLTAAVDVQESPPRLEVEVKAWARDHENWSILYDKIQAFASNGEALPVTSPELWDKLDELLQHEWLHETGNKIPIMVMGIDTGRRPLPVYLFARATSKVTGVRHCQLDFLQTGTRLRTIRTVVPLKGDDNDFQLISGVSRENAAKKRQGVKIVRVGTHRAKREIYDQLHSRQPILDPNYIFGEPSPGCYHFPMYNEEYFEGLTAEIAVRKASGKVEYEKRAGRRNEPLDLAVYARALAAIVGADTFSDEDWDQMEAALVNTEVLVNKADAEMISNWKAYQQKKRDKGDKGEQEVKDESKPENTPLSSNIMKVATQLVNPVNPVNPVVSQPISNPLVPSLTRGIRGKFS
jgi:phage terminase large subunit GpA-like protein